MKKLIYMITLLVSVITRSADFEQFKKNNDVLWRQEITNKALGEKFKKQDEIDRMVLDRLAEGRATGTIVWYVPAASIDIKEKILEHNSHVQARKLNTNN